MPWVRVTLTPRRATPGGVATKISTVSRPSSSGRIPHSGPPSRRTIFTRPSCARRGRFAPGTCSSTAGSTAGPGRFAPATALASTRTCVRSTGSGKCSYCGSPAGASLKTIAKPLRRYDSKMALLPGLQGSIVIGTGSRTCKSRVVLAEHQGEGSGSRRVQGPSLVPGHCQGQRAGRLRGHHDLPIFDGHLSNCPGRTRQLHVPRGSGRRSPVSARCRSRLCTCASRTWARRRQDSPPVAWSCRAVGRGRSQGARRRARRTDGATARQPTAARNEIQAKGDFRRGLQSR